MCRITRSPLGPYFRSMRSCLLGAPSSTSSPVPDVAFALEHLGQAALHLRERHVHVRALDAHRVADAGQHVGDRVGHHSVVDSGSGISVGRQRLTLTPTLTLLLPTRLSHAGNQSLGRPACGSKCGRCRTCGTRPAAGRTAGSGARARVENFGVRLALAIFDLLAIEWSVLAS